MVALPQRVPSKNTLHSLPSVLVFIMSILQQMAGNGLLLIESTQCDSPSTGDGRESCPDRAAVCLSLSRNYGDTGF